VAEHADYQFGPGANAESVAASNRVLLAESAKTGRNVGLYANASVVIDDTDEAARRKVELYERGADHEAIDFMTGQYKRDPAQDGSSALVRKRRSAFYGTPTAGSPATIARYIDSIAAVEGVAGVMLVFDDFIDGMRRFGEEVMPLLECRRGALVTN
jgi:pyrimidine oxygenase